MTTTGWPDETGLIPLPSGARVRGTYHRRAVETPWQRRWLRGVR